MSHEEQRYHYWNTRVLYLIDDILATDGDEYAVSFLDQLIELNSRDREKPILLVISSHGGSIATMGAILDYISAIEAPVHTQAVGDVASAASVLLSAGVKGCRYAAPSARIMIHEPWTAGIGGKFDEVNVEHNELKRCRAWYYDLISGFTGQTVKKLQSDMKRDKWFSASGAVDYGLADAVGLSPLLLQMPTPPPVDCSAKSGQKKSKKVSEV